MSKVLIVTIAIILLFSSGIAYWIFTDWDLPLFGDVQDTGESIGFAEASIETRNLRTYRDLSGVLEYADTIDLVSSVSGILTYIATE